MLKLVVLLVAIGLAVPALGQGERPVRRRLGGWNPADVGDANVIAAAQYAVEQLLQRRSNGMYALKLGGVVSAERQVVSGMHYRLTIDVHTTNCRTGQNVDLSNCASTHTQQCVVTVLNRPWGQGAGMRQGTTGPQCSAITAIPQATTSKPVVVGGPEDIDAATPSAQAAARFAVSQLSSASGGLYTVELTQIKAVTSQIVAGVLFKFTLGVQLTSCTGADRRKPVSICTAPLRTEHTDCTLSVWDQAWRNPRYLLQEYSCTPAAGSSGGQGAPDGGKSDTALRFRSSNKTPKSSGQTIGAGGHDGGSGGDERPKIGDTYADFLAFKSKYGRVYESLSEDASRFETFRANMRRAQFIQDHDLGTATYGATMFADMTPAEFSRYVSAKKWNKAHDPRLTVADIPKDAPPPAFDWRDHNVVTGVKNQGSCGSCWAFSVTGNVEGQWALAKTKLVSLSEQELVDCDKLDEGCNGGLPSNAYTEIQRLGGLEGETDYPYKGEDLTCSFSKGMVKVYINGSLNISSDETQMAAWLYKNGPMSIGINAMAMQFYFGGISHPWKLFCPDALDHGVLIVGYGVKKGMIWGETPYWIIKNSWGEGWGEHGYYLVYRGDGTCGLNEMVSSAIIR